jgi:hypothetical protein
LNPHHFVKNGNFSIPISDSEHYMCILQTCIGLICPCSNLFFSKSGTFKKTDPYERERNPRLNLQNTVFSKKKGVKPCKKNDACHGHFSVISGKTIFRNISTLKSLEHCIKIWGFSEQYSCHNELSKSPVFIMLAQ